MHTRFVIAVSLSTTIYKCMWYHHRIRIMFAMLKDCIMYKVAMLISRQIKTVKHF